MKYRTIQLLLVAWLSTSSFAADPNSETYAFLGLKISALTKSEEAPVVGVTKKRLLVDSSRGLKKIKHSSDLRYSPIFVKTTQLVEISDFKISYDYRRRYQLETEVMGDVMRSEILTESEIGRLSPIGSAPPIRNQQKIEELENEQENRQESLKSVIENDEFASESLVDSAIVKMLVTAPIDINDAFCVVTMHYQSPNSWNRNTTKQVSIGRLRYIGDIMAGVPTKVDVSFRIPEGYAQGLTHHFYLLSGTAENLGTTLSGGLRKLNTETE